MTTSPDDPRAHAAAPPAAPAEPVQGLSVASASHVGHVRERNEDAVLVAAGTGLLAVFDGLGGHAAGDVASLTAAQHVERALTPAAVGGTDDAAAEALLVDVLHDAHRAVSDAARGDRARSGMGTTAVLALVREGRAVLAHVGDSRAYVVADGVAEQVTEDHGAGGFLTQALGLDRGVEPDSRTVSLPPGAALLLCTDGLTDMLDDGGIGRVVAGGGADAAEVADALVAAALEAGGVDNVTVAVAVT